MLSRFNGLFKTSHRREKSPPEKIKYFVAFYLFLRFLLHEKLFYMAILYFPQFGTFTSNPLRRIFFFLLFLSFFPSFPSPPPPLRGVHAYTSGPQGRYTAAHQILFCAYVRQGGGSPEISCILFFLF